MTVTLHHGNCLDILPTLPDCSIDSIVTDPPYELGFMGKIWDASGIAYNITLWQECLRVLKPGGHLLAFGGTRTYHRMACAIEDAGFEIRDSIHWLYGSGFPKSLDVSKAIDKMDAKEEQQARRFRFTEWVRSTGVTAKQIDQATGTFMGHHYTTHPTQPCVMTREHLEACRHLLGDIPAWVERECDIRSVESRNMAEREIIGKREVPVGHSFAGPTYGGDSSNTEVDITAPATEQAKQWAGWGTALKPAHEPVVVARKPLVGTVASNVLEWGTGAINIDATRVAGEKGWPDSKQYSSGISWGDNKNNSFTQDNSTNPSKTLGRWPANVILSHHEDCDDGCVPGCPVALLDQQTGILPSAGKYTNSLLKPEISRSSFYGSDSSTMKSRRQNNYANEIGGASRFFYCAKPSRRERNTGLDHLDLKRKAQLQGSDRDGPLDDVSERFRTTPAQNNHPTVKPLALMRYLVRLVTPPGGTVLEPFAGSGTTLMAATLEGFNAIGIEMTDEYLPIIEGRVAWAEQEANKQQEELDL